MLFKKNMFLLAAVVIVSVLSITTELRAEVIYVNVASVDSDPNGGSWEKAYTDLQDALDPARAQAGDEIWVAKGVYKPDPCDTGAVFNLIDGVVNTQGNGESRTFNVVNLNNRGQLFLDSDVVTITTLNEPVGRFSMTLSPQT